MQLPIKCAHQEQVSVKSLLGKVHPLNPKNHPPQQIASFKKILAHQGIRRAIVISKRSGLIVAGHGLLQALAAMGCDKAPVDFQEFATEADELAHMVADNKLAEAGQINQVQLDSILGSIEQAGLDKALAGIVEDLDSKTPTDLKPVTIQPPPKMGWALVGVPIQHFGKIQKLLEQLPPEAKVCTTANDYEGEAK